MSRWQDQPRDRHESVTIRTIWLTLALSILIHVAALFVLIPHMRTLSDDLEQGESTASTVDEEKERYNRNIAANLPAAAAGVAARDRKNGGGIFEIKRLAYDDAVFEFYGWNKDVGQRTPQSFEVRKGNNADMRI